MRDGGRKPGVMAAVVKTLTDDNIRDLGAYYESLPPPPALKTPSNVDEATVMALIKPRRCDSCHKEDFAGRARPRAWPGNGRTIWSSRSRTSAAPNGAAAGWAP